MALSDNEVFPGDKVLELEEFSSNKTPVVIGPGLKREGTSLIAVKPGVLIHKEPNVWFVDCCQKRVRASL